MVIEERIDDDNQMGGQGTTDNAVPAGISRQPDNDQRGSGAAAQHPQPGTPPLVDAEDELAALITELLIDGISIRFTQNGDGVDVDADPSDDDSNIEGRSAFGPDPLTALRVALDLDWEPA